VTFVSIDVLISC